MEIFAEIKKMKYTPLLCSKLDTYDFGQLETALEKSTSFILRIDDNNKLAVSRWVSAKRTRSYPYERVYNTLGFTGKRITIIPVIKDEGRGDRDFLQWDTISLMSLLGIYVIIGYYVDASVNPRKGNKITDQRFDVDYIKSEIRRLLSYSDAFHWNMEQTEKFPELAKKALAAYERIGSKLGIRMHADESKRISEFIEAKNNFMMKSRKRAEEAQKRESVTTQPKEHLDGTKASITINNYLGGYYFFTSDETELTQNEVYLIEGKHTKNGLLPSKLDIKDGLLKMFLFTNLENVRINGRNYKPIPVLKLTSNKFDESLLKGEEKHMFETLKKEAKINGFELRINNGEGGSKSVSDLRKWFK